jgi:hypothetical protein
MNIIIIIYYNIHFDKSLFDIIKEKSSGNTLIFKKRITGGKNRNNKVKRTKKYKIKKKRNQKKRNQNKKDQI